MVERPRAREQQRAVRLHALTRRHLHARQLAARAHDGRRRPPHPDDGRPARGARCDRRGRPRHPRRLLAHTAVDPAAGAVRRAPGRLPCARRGRVGGGPAPRHPPDVHQRRPGCRDLPRPGHRRPDRAAHSDPRVDHRAVGADAGFPRSGGGGGRRGGFPRGQHLRGRPAGSADHRDARIRLARVPPARDRRPVGVGVGGLSRRERRPRAVLAHERRRRADLPAPKGRSPTATPGSTTTSRPTPTGCGRTPE